MKKIFIILLVFALSLSFLGCGASGNTSAQTDNRAAEIEDSTEAEQAEANVRPDSEENNDPKKTGGENKEPLRPQAVDKDGFVYTGEEIANGFMKMLQTPGILFKTTPEVADRTVLTWDSEHSEYKLDCELTGNTGTIWFFQEASQTFESKDAIPSGMVILSFQLTDGNKEELTAFVTYARALVYLCSTCSDGIEANDVMNAAQDHTTVGSGSLYWVAHDGMEYASQLNSVGASYTYYFYIRSANQNNGTPNLNSATIPPSGFAVDSVGFSSTVGQFLSALERLITNKESEFYAGESCSIEASSTDPDLKSVIKLGDNTLIFTFSRADSEESLNANDSFQHVIMVAFLRSENGTDNLEKILSAIIYLTDDRIADYADSKHFLDRLANNADSGNWTQNGVMEYILAAETGMIGLSIRETAAYD